MAENIPNLPGGAVPPKPAEAAKVQPKKETVRINLPPKPTASPTIKLPTLPPGGAPSATIKLPTVVAGGAPSSVGASPGSSPTGPRVQAASSTSGPATRIAAAPTAQRPAATSAPAASRASRTSLAPAVSGVDKGLAFAAALISVVALGSAVYLAFFLIQPGN